MEQKVIVVTGSNKGIGKAVVEKLLQEAPEFNVVIMTSRDTERGNAAKQEIEQSGIANGRLVYHQLDVIDKQSIEIFRQYIEANYNKIDVLINNAGIAFKGNAWGGEVARATIQTNLHGMMYVTEGLLPVMKEGGHIINVTSMAGKFKKIPDENLRNKFLSTEMTREELLRLAEDFIEGVEQDNWRERGWQGSTYSVSKVLANGYTRVLDRELKAQGRNLRVNAMCPGWIATDMAGPNATGTVEEGARTPVMLAKYTGQESGRFWENQQMKEWDELN